MIIIINISHDSIVIIIIIITTIVSISHDTVASRAYVPSGSKDPTSRVFRAQI